MCSYFLREVSNLLQIYMYKLIGKKNKFSFKEN